jgi:hypothetical protein
MALPMLACNLRLPELHGLESARVILSTGLIPKKVLQKNANRALTEMPGGRGMLL